MITHVEAAASTSAPLYQRETQTERPCEEEKQLFQAQSHTKLSEPRQGGMKRERWERFLRFYGELLFTQPHICLQL